MSMFSLSGRVAIVTGASSGLGARFARTLAGAGARLVLAARRAERIEQLARELPDAIAVPTDVREDQALEHLVDATIEAYGAVDVLVNNAGVVDTTPAVDEQASRIREVMDTNLIAPLLLSRRVAREMAGRDGGAIVNIASAAAVVAARLAPEASYVASKGGLVALTRELAKQWAMDGIRVNAIGPGYFESEMTAELFASEDDVAEVARHTPMGRPGAPHELDGALLFLASPASSYVTGQLLLVDGGWTVI